MKVTFLGDIMCEPSVLKGAKQKDGTYNFNYVFDGVRDYLKESDCLIGNLETPVAGEAATYSSDFACFNAPDAYVDALKEAGFHLISTANNHTFDRGYDGLVNTIRCFDEKGVPHTGTFLPGQPRHEAYYLDIQGVKLAIIAYTYGTNFYASGKKCSATEGEYAGTVNLLRPQTESVFLPSILSGSTWFDRKFKKLISYDNRGRIKHALGFFHSYPRPDHNLNKETMAPYVEQFQSDIRKAKEKADFVIFYPHTGGQFDPHPGAVTEYVVEKAVEAGADAVIASHAHVVQNAKMFGNIPCLYSLGNFNMDPTSGLVVPQYLPGCGLALHLHIEAGKLQKVTFGITDTRMEGKRLVTRLVCDRKPMLKEKDAKLLEKQARQVYETVTRKPLTGDFIRKEYLLWEAENV